jgi:hypothetical protein
MSESENQDMLQKLLEDPEMIFSLCNKSNAFGIPIYKEASESQLLELFKNVEEGYYGNLIFLTGLPKADNNQRHLKVWLDVWKNKEIGSFLYTAMEVYAVAENQDINQFITQFLKNVPNMTKEDLNYIFSFMPQDHKNPQKFMDQKTQKSTQQTTSEEKEQTDTPFEGMFNDQIKQMLKFLGIKLDPKTIISKVKQSLEKLTGKQYSDEDIFNMKWMQDIPPEMYEQLQNPQMFGSLFEKMMKNFNKDKNQDKDSEQTQSDKDKDQTPKQRSDQTENDNSP